MLQDQIRNLRVAQKGLFDSARRQRSLEALKGEVMQSVMQRWSHEKVVKEEWGKSVDEVMGGGFRGGDEIG